jgi:tetratricopeptide (TPR) repeat protein
LFTLQVVLDNEGKTLGIQICPQDAAPKVCQESRVFYEGTDLTFRKGEQSASLWERALSLKRLKQLRPHYFDLLLLLALARSHSEILKPFDIEVKRGGWIHGANIARLDHDDFRDNSLHKIFHAIEVAFNTYKDENKNPGIEIKKPWIRIVNLEVKIEADVAAAICSRFKEKLNDRFHIFGRELEMKELLGSFTDQPANNIIGIVGMGGAGKTAFAKEILRHSRMYGYHFHTHVIEIDRNSSNEELDARRKKLLEKIARALELNWQDQTLWEEQLRKIRNCLPKDRTLFLIDSLERAWNAADPGYNTLLDDIVSIFDTTHHTVLITTRRELRRLSPSPIKIEGLRDLRGVQLLRSFLRDRYRDNFDDPKHDPLLRDIVTKCGGLPKALQLAAGAVRNIGLDGVLKSLPSIELDDDMPAQAAEAKLMDYLFCLPYDSMGKLSYQILHVLANFTPERGADPAKLAALCKAPEVDVLSEINNVLTKWFLLEITGDAAIQLRYWLHELLDDFLYKVEFEIDQKEAIQRCVDYWSDFITRKNQSFEDIEVEFPNIRKVLKNPKITSEQRAKLVKPLTGFFIERCYWTDLHEQEKPVIDYFAAVKAWRELAEMHLELARSYYRIGDMENMKRSLDHAERATLNTTDDSRNEVEAELLFVQSAVYRKEKKFEEARKLCQKSLDLLERSTNKRLRIGAHYNMAAAYIDDENKYDSHPCETGSHLNAIIHYAAYVLENSPDPVGTDHRIRMTNRLFNAFRRQGICLEKLPTNQQGREFLKTSFEHVCIFERQVIETQKALSPRTHVEFLLAKMEIQLLLSPSNDQLSSIQQCAEKALDLAKRKNMPYAGKLEQIIETCKKRLLSIARPQ